MDPAPSGGDGRRHGKKNRGKKGRNRRGSNKGRVNRGNQRYNQQQKGYVPPEHGRDDTSILGGRQPRTGGTSPVYEEGKAPDAFLFFCAYHLGITPDDGYSEPRFEQITRRFGLTPEELREELKKHSLDDQTMRESSFDLKGARMDMRLAPVGISRTESARELYEEYQESLDS